jgi:hypothetical protein
MTTLGGIGHTLPFLLHEFQIALGIAIVVVLVESPGGHRPFDCKAVVFQIHLYLTLPP